MAVFNVTGYLMEERRRWPVITGTIFQINSEFQMKTPYRLPGWTINSSYYSAPGRGLGLATSRLLY